MIIRGFNGYQEFSTVCEGFQRLSGMQGFQWLLGGFNGYHAGFSMHGYQLLAFQVAQTEHSLKDDTNINKKPVTHVVSDKIYIIPTSNKFTEGDVTLHDQKTHKMSWALQTAGKLMHASC